MWTQNNETYERFVQDPDTMEVARVKLRGLAWGTTLKAGEIELSQKEDGAGVGRMSPGDTKLYQSEMALVSWELPMGPPTRDLLKQLNPLVGEQIYYYVDVGEGAPKQRPLVDAEGNKIELKTSDGSLLELDDDRQRGNGIVPLASSVDAAVPS